MSIKHGKIYYINSLYRETGNSSDFSYRIQIPTSEHYDHVVVLQASIPLSYYLIRDGFNTFIVKENDVDYVITLEPGNYSYQEFIDIVTQALNFNSPNGYLYEMTFSTISAKFTFTVSNKLDSNPLGFKFTNSVAYQAGLNLNEWHYFIDDKLVSKNVVNFLPESVVNLHSDIVSEDDGILQEIYSNNHVYFSNLVYNLTTDYMTYAKKLRTTSSNAFHFTLKDSDDNYLDTNGLPILITLLLFKKSNFEDNITEYIKYKFLQNENENSNAIEE